MISRVILWMRGDDVAAKLRRELNVRIEELREAYNLMHQARDEREALRERLVAMTRAVPGPWKVTKDGRKRYRRWEYPHARSIYRTESESIQEKCSCGGSGCWICDY